MMDKALTITILLLCGAAVYFTVELVLFIRATLRKKP